MRFPEIGLELTRIDPRIDLKSTLPDRVPDGPEMASDTLYPDLRYPMVRIRAYLTLLLIFGAQKVSRPRIGYARLLVPSYYKAVTGTSRSFLRYKPR